MRKHDIIIQADNLEALADHGFKKVTAAIGIFDGAHLGHQELLRELFLMSDRLGAEPVVISFHPHPRVVLRPDDPLLLLQTLEQKAKALMNMGVKALVTLPFTRHFADLPPEAFLAEFLRPKRVSLVGVCVGRSWRFGANASGDIATLQTFAEANGLELTPVDTLTLNGHKVSSTAIREALLAGDLDGANAMLGRKFAIVGEVVQGEKVASAVLGFPTANVAPRNHIVPRYGVYAGYARIVRGLRRERKRKAVIAVGVAPTFHPEGARPKVEAHLLDCRDALYGQELELEFYKYLRGERRFASAEELRGRIEEDIRLAREALLAPASTAKQEN